MTSELRAACDAVLGAAVAGGTDGRGRVPGVVAMVTDRDATLYEGAAGEREIGGRPMETDDVFAIFSTTKSVTGTAVMQCVEEGLLDLDAPTREYLPEIGALQVLEGFEADGTPRLRPPKSEITTRQLMLHTAGLGYEFFNASCNRLARERGLPGVATGMRAALRTPLLFDPGERWEYGSGIDWCGQVVEAIRGRRLGEILAERVFAPLGIADMAFVRTADMKARTVAMHRRDAEGGLAPIDFALPDDPEIEMGGHGLYGSIAEYMKFIRMWLNDGAGPHGRVLRPETVRLAVANGHEPHRRVTRLPGVNRRVSKDVEFFPGCAKGWSYTFMVMEEDAPTGRPRGAIGWAGLANLFYWIDRTNGLGGFWATQILPFGDPVSLRRAMEFEASVYRTAGRSAAASAR